MPPQRTTSGWEEKLLWMLLVFSFLLRVWLIAKGGPLSWPDDPRYFRSATVVEHLQAGRIGSAVDLLVTPADHTLFTAVGLLPELARAIARQLAGEGSSMIAVAASVLALASVANIGLVYLVTRAAGAESRQALAAAFLLACASSTLHLSRHLVPYEAALTFALLALWFAIDRRGGAVRSAACGIFAALCFLTYNAFWVAAAVVPLVHLLLAERSRDLLRRGLAAAAGFFLPVAVLCAIAIARGQTPFIAGLRQFSQGITFGDYSEGWSLPWAYFWHAEHLILLLWVAAPAVIVWRAVRGDRQAWRFMAISVVPLVLIYGVFAVGSTVLQRFVVAGRSMNQMVPFFCLAAAFALVQIRSGKLQLALLAAVLVQAVANFAEISRIVFPYEFRERMQARYTDLADTVSVGSQLWHMRADGFQFFDDHYTPAAAEREQTARYVLVNGGVLFLPITGPRQVPKGKVLARAPHMLSYRPYQYQAFNPRDRAILRSADLSMRLIDRAPAD